MGNCAGKAGQTVAPAASQGSPVEERESRQGQGRRDTLLRSDALLRDAQASQVQKVLQFRNRCDAAEIGWVKFSFLRQTRGKVLPRRQQLPEDALVVGAPPSRVTRWVISHPWLAKQHPDITGEQLSQVVGTLERLGAVDADVVFFDWLSMFQAYWGTDDRTSQQKKLFALALKSMNMLYSSDLCKVVVVSDIPESAKRDKWLAGTLSLKCIGDAREFWLEPNATPYFQRGWCFFEVVTTLLFGTAAELSEDMMTALKGVLADMFKLAKFGNPDDAEQVHARAAQCILDFHTTATWETHTEMLEQSFRDGDIRLVKAGYIRSLHGAKKGLPGVVEDVPPDAWGSPEDCARAGRIFVVSNAWTTKEHCDPDGWRVADIVRKLDRLEVEDEDLVYVDWLSIDLGAMRFGMTDQLRKAVKWVPTLYMHPRSRTIVSWTAPPNGGDRLYHERGWCLFELIISAFAGTLVYDDTEIVDIIVEKFFMTSLKTKVFTNGATDMQIVAELFRGLLYERAGLSRLHDGPHGGQQA